MDVVGVQHGAWVARAAGDKLTVGSRLDWEDRELLWAVREPFVSRQSRAELVCGRLAEGDELVVESRMGQHGVVFSDGVERDALPFVAGSRVVIRVAGQRAHLVVA